MVKMKMMLVDDEERFLSTTKKLLARKGYDVLTAASGNDALETLKSRNVDIVILDVKMPGMHGMTTLKKGIEVLYIVLQIGIPLDGVSIYLVT